MAGLEMCKNHPSAPAASKCSACGAGICRECVKAFGYFCSGECKATVKARSPDVVGGVSHEASEQIAAGARAAAKWAGWGMVGLVTVIVLWIAVPIMLAPEPYEAWAYGDGRTAITDPIMKDGRLIFADEKGSLRAIDPATGAVAWEKAGAFGKLGGDISLLDCGSAVAVTSGQKVIGLDPASGATVYTLELAGYGESVFPAEEGGVFIFASTMGKTPELRSLDGKGKLKWKVPVAGIGSMFSVEVVAIPGGSGAVVWDSGGIVMVTPKGAGGAIACKVSSVAVTRDAVVAVGMGSATAFDFPKGGQLWTIALAGAVSQPAIIDGVVYIAASDFTIPEPGESDVLGAKYAADLSKGFDIQGKGKTAAFDLATGRLLWETEPGGTVMRCGGELVIYSSRAVVRLLESGDDMFGSDCRLVGISRSSGGQRWEYVCPKNTGGAWPAGELIIIAEKDRRKLEVVNVRFRAIGTR